ncbi:uncharacterized protein [Anoplolepis gracilipes]|uniref:uncharacterized protein isoform X1 n=1 Tax=Anoplolepis gracilipes TaxID=354296 RepID=UPI003BA1FE19
MKKRGGGGPRRYRATAEQPQDQRVHYNSAVAHCIVRRRAAGVEKGKKGVVSHTERLVRHTSSGPTEQHIERALPVYEERIHSGCLFRSRSLIVESSQRTHTKIGADLSRYGSRALYYRQAS